MQVFRHWQGLPAEARGAAVAIGNFDGVHRGHRIVIAEASAVAFPLHASLGVMSFEPHPRAFFKPDTPPFRLTPFRLRARLLDALGVDLHFVLAFDRALSEKSAESFIGEVLVSGLAVRHVIIGYDFCFGRDRSGNARTLLEYGRQLGFGVTVVTKASDETGGAYSSTTVRDRLQAGRPRDAAELLGRPWEIEGRVEPGDRRGRLLGYPTANIRLGEFLRPAYGVYAVRAAVDDGGSLEWRNGVANLGVRPMYALDEPLLEVFLFDFAGDLYGKHLRVQLVEFLRGEARFDNVEQLVAQMDKDAARARETLV